MTCLKTLRLATCALLSGLACAHAAWADTSPATSIGPPLPDGTSTSATFFTYPNGSVLQGGIANGGYYTFGGGPSTPYTGQLLTFGNSSSQVQLQSVLAPVASALAVATQSNAYGRSQSYISLGYRVLLVAPDAQAASQISALLGTSGAIATVSGSFDLESTGYGYGSVQAVTGGLTGLDASLGASSYTACGAYGVLGGPGTPGCGTGSFNLPLNFVAGSSFSGGNPLSFVSTISIQATAQAGISACCSGGYAGNFSAFIDPQVTLANGITATLVLGNNGDVSNDTPAVPEPAPWALMLAGAGFAATLRRRRGESFRPRA